MHIKNNHTRGLSNLPQAKRTVFNNANSQAARKVLDNKLKARDTLAIAKLHAPPVTATQKLAMAAPPDMIQKTQIRSQGSQFAAYKQQKLVEKQTKKRKAEFLEKLRPDKVPVASKVMAAPPDLPGGGRSEAQLMLLEDSEEEEGGAPAQQGPGGGVLLLDGDDDY